VSEVPGEKGRVVVASVVGEQFAWNIHYPGPDGVFGKTSIDKIDVQSNPLGLDRSDPAAKDDVTTVNQLHLPVDKPVIVHLASKDVIHSFNVPEMRIKQDAVPGSTSRSGGCRRSPPRDADQARQPQFVYEIACAQLCGIGHSGCGRSSRSTMRRRSRPGWMSRLKAAQSPATTSGSRGIARRLRPAP
jgi:cytochrome c oxidase subunit 2